MIAPLQSKPIRVPAQVVVGAHAWPSTLSTGLKAMPSQYQRNKAALNHFVTRQQADRIPRHPRGPRHRARRPDDPGTVPDVRVRFLGVALQVDVETLLRLHQMGRAVLATTRQRSLSARRWSSRRASWRASQKAGSTPKPTTSDFRTGVVGYRPQRTAHEAVDHVGASDRSAQDTRHRHRP